MKIYSDEAIRQINGSVSVANEASNFINEDVKLPFVAGAETVQGQLTDGRIIGRHQGEVHGYLVYKFFVANTANQIGHLNHKRVDLKSRSSPSADCPVAFWSVFLVENALRHLAGFYRHSIRKQTILFCQLVFPNCS